MATVLLSGANGFIGSHLVRALLEKGHQVRCLIRHTSDISTLHGLPVTLFIGDVRAPDTLIEPMKNVDYVYHLAAELMVTSQKAFENTNTQGTINMLEAAEKYAGKNLKRFLFVSSQAAAGPGKSPTPLTEENKPQPMSWYGTAKKKAEDAALAFGERIPVTIVRPCAVYGEREKDIAQTFNVVEYRIQPKLGIKKKYLVMVHVEDLVAGIIGAAESEKTKGEIYFLNHPELLTTKKVIQITAEVMNKKWGLMLPAPLFFMKLAAPFAELLHHFTRERAMLTRDKAREVAQRFWVSDASKAGRDFGWVPRYSLLEGMKKTIPAFRAEHRKMKIMPEETGFLAWLKIWIAATLLGTVVEAVCFIGDFYRFHPEWLRIVIIIGAFGFGLGSLARLMRKCNSLIQFICATVITGAAEMLNEMALKFWTFTSGWPLGITNPWLRSTVLGMAGGFVVLLANLIMQKLYRQRLRVG